MVIRPEGRIQSASGLGVAGGDKPQRHRHGVGPTHTLRSEQRGDKRRLGPALLVRRGHSLVESSIIQPPLLHVIWQLLPVGLSVFVGAVAVGVALWFQAEMAFGGTYDETAQYEREPSAKRCDVIRRREEELAVCRTYVNCWSCVTHNMSPSVSGSWKNSNDERTSSTTCSRALPSLPLL